jgi:hypothetical protein
MRDNLDPIMADLRKIIADEYRRLRRIDPQLARTARLADKWTAAELENHLLFGDSLLPQVFTNRLMN